MISQPHIYKASELDEIYKSVNIKIPLVLGNKTIMDIYCNKMSAIYIETPIMYIASDYQLSLEYPERIAKYLDVCECNSHPKFVTNLYKLLNRIKKNKVDKYDPQLIGNRDELNNLLISSQYIDTDILRFINIAYNSIDIYDINRNPIRFSALIRDIRVRMIIAIRYIWITDTCYSYKIEPINIQLQQLSYMPITLSQAPPPPPPPPPPPTTMARNPIQPDGIFKGYDPGVL